MLAQNAACANSDGVPKIVIDLRMVGGRLHGIARYALELIARVPRLRPHWKFVALTSPRQAPLVGLPSNVEVRETVTRFLSPLEQPDLLAALLRERPALVHSTSFSVPFLWPGKMVVTLHDATHLAFPEYFGWSRAIYYRALVKPRACLADGLITVSHFAQKDLSKRLGIPPERFKVIALGASETFRVAALSEVQDFVRRKSLPEKFFTAIGNSKPHKNLAALAPVSKALPYPLVLITGGAVKRSLGFSESTIEIESLSEEEMPLFLSAAQALLMPSLYEGFGLPMIEAMACGCPVIAADAAALPETGGEAALYVPPNAVNEWGQLARRIASEPDFRRQVSERGLERARTFSWNACAAETLAVYEQSL